MKMFEKYGDAFDYSVSLKLRGKECDCPIYIGKYWWVKIY